MCHIHTNEHCICMTKNPLMVLRCIDSFKEHNKLLFDYLQTHEIIIITNKYGIGECLFLHNSNMYIPLDSIEEFFNLFAPDSSPVYNRIIEDDSFGWNIYGMGLVNFCVNYFTESQDCSADNDYFWYEDEWSIDKMLGLLNDTESILANCSFTDSEFNRVVRDNKFNIYRVNYDDSLRFLPL